MTNSLPDKPSKTKDEVIRTLRTVLHLIPLGIGSGLDFQIFDRMAARDWERLQAFVESLAGDLEALASERPDFLKQEFFDTDEFRFILREVLTRAAREHREEKIKAFRAALLNSMGNDPRIDFDRKAFFLDVLDSLTVDQLTLLVFLDRCRKGISGIAFPDEGDLCRLLRAEDDVAFEYVKSGVNALVVHQLATTRLRHLPRLALDERNVIGVPPPGPDIVSYKLSALGAEFLEFVSAKRAE